MKKLYEILATGVYVGYFPIAPGTYGSLTASLIIFVTSQFTDINLAFRIILSLATFIIGLAAVHALTSESSEKDPGYIVIDEWAGQFTTYCFADVNLENIIVGLILFRIFDISKFYPANKAEKLKGSLGVMTDDIIAGLYAGIGLYLWDRFI